MERLKRHLTKRIKGATSPYYARGFAGEATAALGFKTHLSLVANSTFIRGAPYAPCRYTKTFSI